MRKKIEVLDPCRRLLVLLFCAAALSGCGSAPSGPASSEPPPSGIVVQGLVRGATVFADHLTGTEANIKIDADEVATSTTTDVNGNWTLSSTPGYTHLLVSLGGTDTLTGQLAVQMSAPAGSRVISPLTTMVALNPGVQPVIESLGVKYDDNVSARVTPAALLFLQSVQTTMTALTKILNPNNTLLPAQVHDIQQILFAQIADQIRNLSAAQLTDPAALTAALETAVTNALIIIDNKYTNVTIANAATVAADVVAPAVNTVAAAITTATGSNTFSTSTTAAVAEASIITPAAAGSINTTTTQAVTTVVFTSNLVIITPPPNQPTTPPVLSGTPATSVVAGASYSFVPTSSDADGDVLYFGIANKPVWATFDPVTGGLTGTPAASNVGTTTGIVISVSDGITTVALPAFNLTVNNLSGSGGGTP